MNIAGSPDIFKNENVGANDHLRVHPYIFG